MSISNVALTDTFDTWRVRSNQSFAQLNGLFGASGANTITANTFIANRKVDAAQVNANDAVFRTSTQFSGTADFSNTSNVTFSTISTVSISGGTSGQAIITDGAGTLSFGTPTVNFTDLTGDIANTQYGALHSPSVGTWTQTANTVFQANADLGAIGNVHISGGVSGNFIQTDGAGNLSFANSSLSAGSVGTTELADGAVTSPKIGSNTIQANNIATGAVGNTEISDGAVGEAELDSVLNLAGKTVTLNSVFARTDTNQTFEKSQVGQPVTVGTFGDVGAETTLSLNFANGNHFTVTVANNITLGAPTNANSGQTGSIFITQDGTGSRTVSFNVNWHFPSGTAPTLSTTANAEDRIDYIVKSANNIHAVATLDSQ